MRDSIQKYLEDTLGLKVLKYKDSFLHDDTWSTTQHIYTKDGYRYEALTFLDDPNNYLKDIKQYGLQHVLKDFEGGDQIIF